MSWLDHCICTADAHASLDNIIIHYELATTDHIPIELSIKVDNIPMISVVDSTSHTVRLDWSKLSENDIKQYTLLTDRSLDSVDLPREAILCTD